jgi:hypothetical protein
VQKREFEYLLKYDQLRVGILEGSIFRTFVEAEITFPPTFKYDVGTDTFDTSTKHRVPSYTDRVLFRFLNPDEELVAPFAPVKAGMSNVLGRVARPFVARHALRYLGVKPKSNYPPVTPHTPQVGERAVSFVNPSAASLESLADLEVPIIISRSASPAMNGTGDPIAAELVTSPGADVTSPAVTSSEAASPNVTSPMATSPESRRKDRTFFEEVKAAAQATAAGLVARPGSAGGDSDKNSSGSKHNGQTSPADVDKQQQEHLYGFPYILNHLVVERYCSYMHMRGSDHKPVAAAFRAAIVRKDPEKTKRVVFEELQRLEFNDFGAASDLDCLYDHEG